MKQLLNPISVLSSLLGDFNAVLEMKKIIKVVLKLRHFA
jgi:hypothetical protein